MVEKKAMEAEFAKDDLEKRAVEAAKTYLQRHGYDVVEDFPGVPETGISLLAYDNDIEGFAAVVVSCSRDNVPEEITPKEARFILESSFPSIVPHCGVDVSIRLDQVSIRVLGDDRAMLKHHIAVSKQNPMRRQRLQWLADFKPELILSAFGERQRSWLMEEVCWDDMVEQGEDSPLWNLDVA